MRLAAIAITPQCHVLVVFAHAQARVLQQVTRVRGNAAATKISRACAQPTRVSCQEMSHPGRIAHRADMDDDVGDPAFGPGSFR
jgi:hypothetical protein